MASSPATRGDLSGRALRTLTADELNWGAVRLADAYDQIAVRLPTVPRRLDDSPAGPYARLVVQIQVAMVLRVLANPDYVRQQGIDDSTTILDAAVSSGALYITDGEAALLSAGDGSADGAWTIRARPTQRTYPFGPGSGFTGTMGNVL